MDAAICAYRRIRSAVAAAAFALVALVAPAAFGGLWEGLPGAVHGFPISYLDPTGLALQPCLVTTGECGPPLEVPTIFPSPLPVQYWTAIARMQTYGGKGGNPDASRPGGQATATLIMQLMGTFPLNANGDVEPIEGNQIVIQSLQIRMDSLLDQELYTVTTPFGVFDDIPADVALDGDGLRTRNVDSIKETFQLPAEPVVPGNVNQTIYPTSPYSADPWSFSGMDRLLTCVGGPQLSGFLAPGDLETGAPLECTITGSPLGSAFDVFRIEGPEVGGGPTLWAELAGTPFAIGLDPWVPGAPPVNMIETTQFMITGQTTVAIAACSDGGDNDGDGLVDFPDDPGCDAADDLSEWSSALPCDDGVDNDGDGLADFPEDPGCDSVGDLSERSPVLVCDDGVDNDGDSLIDFPTDPGCAAPNSGLENPHCQDGIDNDGDGDIDFDGGASVNGGIPLAGGDHECTSFTRTSERNGRRCALGAELALALPGLLWLRRRRQRRA